MVASDRMLPIARRSAWRDDCLEVVCGIANAGGGRLILNADVDSRGSVRRRTNRIMKSIPPAVDQALGLVCAVELVLDGGRFCLEVVIPPASEPLSYRGVFYFYQDGANHVLDDEALDRLLQRDLEPDIKWELLPVVQASTDDLNLGLVTRFTGAARDTDLTTDLDETAAIEEALRYEGLMTGVGTPTNAGILLLHDQPQRFIPGATVRIGFFGARGITPIFEDEVRGSLIEQLHGTVELLFEKYLPRMNPFAGSPATGPHGALPPRDAIHEAILNALAHKNYGSGTPVQVSVFSDRLCIDNVGRPPRTWDVGTLLGRHTSRPNNPSLVAALRSLGIIDGWGNGIGAIRMHCMEAGVPEPLFSLRDDETMVCFPTDNDSLLAASMAPSPHLAPAPVPRTELAAVQVAARAAAMQHETSLTFSDERVLALIDIDGRLTAPRIARNLGVSESTVRRSFRRLRELGLITRIGSDKSGFWQVN